MKKILTILFVLLSFGLRAQISVVTSHTDVFGVGGGTGASFSTAGANMLYVVLTYRTAGSGGNLSDSKSCTWIKDAEYQGGSSQSGITIYHCKPCSVGTGHTFSTTNDDCGLNVLAVSGASTSSPLDQTNGQYLVTSVSPMYPLTITPSFSNCIVVTGVCDVVAGASAPTIPSGYTVIGATYPTSTAYSGGAAYKIQTTAGAENGGWTITTSGGNASAAQASFKSSNSSSTNSLILIMTQ